MLQPSSGLNAPSPQLNTRTWVQWNVLSGIALIALGGFNMTLLDRFPALIGWLPAGASLALVLIKGPRLWPGVFFGVMLTELLLFGDLTRALLWGAESVLSCLGTWYLLNRRHLFDLAQRRISDVGLMLLVATILSTTVATISGPRGHLTATQTHQNLDRHKISAQPPGNAHSGHSMEVIDKPISPVQKPERSGTHPEPSMLAWVLADAIGIFLVVPLVLRGYRWSLHPESGGIRKRLAASAVLSVLVVVSFSIYGGILEERFGIRHTTLLILPPAVWLALKYDLGFTVAGNIMMFLIAGIGTSLGHGPFSDHSSGLPLLTFITLFTTLLIAAGRTERKVAEETIHRMATEDPLTGLPNRNALNQRLAQALDNARRYQRSVAVMFIDLDHFKHANDSYGHEVGDQLLIEAARKLSGSLRGDSMLARFGGDEFIALIDHVDNPAALDIVGQRMINALAQPIIIDGHECRISCSGGIAVFPSDGDNAVELLKNADIAMYHIKSRGRNGFQAFSHIRPGAGPSSPDRRTELENVKPAH